MTLLAGDHPCRGIVQRVFREPNRVIGVLIKQVCLNNVLDICFSLVTLYFGEVDVLFQYPSVYDPTNFSEEPKFYYKVLQLPLPGI